MSCLPTRLPLLSNARFSGFLSLRGYPNSRNLPLSQQFSESRVIFQKKMAPNSVKCDADVDDRLGVVHPATEAYAKDAIEALKSGKVIAVPTDTLYGFACDACSLDAVNRIYEIKGRQHTSPLAICVGDVLDIKNFAVTDHLPLGLLDSLLPGPVTVVLKRGESSILEKSLNPGLESIAVRVPDCDFIRSIARGLGSALALTSANLSGQLSSLCVKDFENLWEHCANVYDGGSLPSSRAGSTIVDLTQVGKFRILRPGSAKDETLEILEKHTLMEASSTGKNTRGGEDSANFPGCHERRTAIKLHVLQSLLPLTMAEKRRSQHWGVTIVCFSFFVLWLRRGDRNAGAGVGVTWTNHISSSTVVRLNLGLPLIRRLFEGRLHCWTLSLFHIHYRSWNCQLSIASSGSLIRRSYGEVREILLCSSFVFSGSHYDCVCE